MTASRETDPVDAQVAAYNAHDIDAFVACYAHDIVVEDGAGAPLSIGLAALREQYAALFANFPKLHCYIVRRVVEGHRTVDDEIVTGLSPTPYRVVVSYEVRDGMIVRVRILPPPRPPAPVP